MEQWNRRDTRPPPNLSVKVKKGTVDLKNLQAILHDALKILDFKYTLHQEAAILSRFLYKTKRRCGSHKQFEYMGKVKQGLQRYINLNLDVVYRNFCLLISSNEGVDLFDEWCYVPTKQMLEYLLVRTQGFCKVMYYVMVACQNCTLHLKNVLQIGHNINDNVMGLSLISRIWCCSKYYVMFTFQWYSQLLPFLNVLKVSGPRWLPEGYEFPDDLRTWLGPDPLTGEIMPCFADVQKISKEVEKENQDIGEPVKRSDFRRMLPTSKYAKLLMCAEDIPLPKPLYETPKEIVDTNPSEDISHDIGDKISREEYSLAKLTDRCAPVENIDSFPEMDCSLSKQMELGSAGSPIEPSETSCSDLPDTGLNINVNPKSKAVQLFMATMGQISKMGSTKESQDQSVLLGARRKNCSVAKVAVKQYMGNENEEKTLMKKAPSTLQNSEEFSKHLEMKSIDVSCQPKSTKHPVSDSAKTFPAGKRKLLQKISNGSDPSNHETLISFSDNGQKQSVCETKNLSISKKSTSLGLKISSSLEQKPEVSKCVISKKKLAPQKKSKLKENIEIINGIRTVNDVKVFLRAEKKARAKRKMCVTSQLSEGDWKVLVETIRKILKKPIFLKLKGKRQSKSVMNNIRRTLSSFI